MDEEKRVFQKLPHHDQQNLCFTRAKYRQGRKFTAVKTYSVADESRYLLVQGVPTLGLQVQLDKQARKFGPVNISLAPEYPCEQFTEAYILRYQRIQSARVAKKHLDTRSFYGSLLHVCYAPELETVTDTEEKILQRTKSVVAQLKRLAKEKEQIKKTESKEKLTDV